MWPYIFLLVLLPSFTHAIIQDYNSVNLIYGYYIQGLVEMYSQSDAPKTIFHNEYQDHSFIETNLIVQSSQPNSAFEIVVAQVINSSTIGKSYIDNNDVQQNALCCTYELYKKKLCNNLNRVLIQNQNETAAQIYFFDFKNSTLLQANIHYNVVQTGEHLLMLVNCEQLTKFVVNGQATYMNPYGHLPGRLFNYLPFYIVLSVIYAFMSAVWLLLMAIYRKDLTMIQRCIAIVLLICFLEAILSFSDFYYWNTYGKRKPMLMGLAICISVSKQTLSRMLLISVCLGWGTVRPSLGSSKLKLILLGTFYFIGQAAFEVVARWGASDDSAEKLKVVLILPVALLNACFWWWLFIALARLLRYLSLRQQTDKLKKYKKFTVVLAVALVAVLAYACYEIFFLSIQQQLMHWSNLYLLDNGIPEIIYAFVLFGIAMLFPPSTEAKKLAYSQLVAPADDFETFDNDTGGGEISTNVMSDSAYDHEIELGNLSSDDDIPTQNPNTVDNHFTIDSADDMLPSPHQDHEIVHDEKGGL